MKCRPATRADIPEMTRIITGGFLEYPLHIMLKSYLYRAEHYPECVTVINRMLADSYQRVRHALVVEHEGRVVGTALLHDRKVGFVRSFLSGGYEFFRYASPLLVKEFSDAVDSGDQVTAEKGDFDWYLEVLSVDKQMRGRGVGRWLVSQVLPDYVAKRGGRAYGFVTSTEENARFYLNGGCELLDRFDIHLRDETCPIWSFQRRAELL